MPAGTPLPKELIQKIHEEVLKGKTKYQVAKELGRQNRIVYSHTSDLPSVRLGEPCIKGRSLDLLRQLLDIGYVASNNDTHYFLRKLKRHLPMIQWIQINGKSMYYLNDKNKNALQAMLSLKKSKIISYQELKSITKIFDVNLSRDEKHRYVKPIWNDLRPVIRKEKRGVLSSMKKNQAKLDDFIANDDFLGRNTGTMFTKI